MNCIHAYPAGEAVDLRVTSVWGRDGGLSLYGFETEAEQQVFAALCRVSRVGPSAAMALLREHGAAGVVTRARRGDARALAAPGVGVKTAESIIALATWPAIDEDNEPAAEHDSILDALIGMGLDETRAGHALAWARENHDGAVDDGSVLRRALLRYREV